MILTSKYLICYTDFIFGHGIFFELLVFLSPLYVSPTSEDIKPHIIINTSRNFLNKAHLPALYNRIMFAIMYFCLINVHNRVLMYTLAVPISIDMPAESYFLMWSVH